MADVTETTKSYGASVTVNVDEEKLTIINPCSTPMYWNGHEFTPYNPKDKITVEIKDAKD
jgi:hypothetical protein